MVAPFGDEGVHGLDVLHEGDDAAGEEQDESDDAQPTDDVEEDEDVCVPHQPVSPA